MEDNLNGAYNDLYSKAIKAGKRTYFFDVKSTKANQYYLTLTESKKRFTEDGKFTYDKHKIFLYREDFEKFTDALKDAISFIEKNSEPLEIMDNKSNDSSYVSDIKFDDLDK